MRNTLHSWTLTWSQALASLLLAVLPVSAIGQQKEPSWPPLWLDRLGTHLRADKDHWVHQWEASQPTPANPLRCGVAIQLRTHPTITGRGKDGSIPELAVAWGCKNL